MEEIDEVLQKDGISNRSGTTKGMIHLFPDGELQRTRRGEEEMVLLFCRRGRAEEGTIRRRGVIARNAKKEKGFGR